MRQDLLKVFAGNLIKMALESDEVKKEVKKSYSTPDGRIRKIFKYDFANFVLKFVVDSEANVNENSIKYELREKDSDEILISNLS